MPVYIFLSVIDFIKNICDDPEVFRVLEKRGKFSE